MNKVVYNIETYVNYFSCTVEDFYTDDLITFEISERRNDLDLIYKFFTSKELEYLVGFNNNKYDNILTSYLILNYQKLKDLHHSELNSLLKQLNDTVTFDIKTESRRNYEAHSPYFFNFFNKSIDIFLFWSKMLRLSKKLSLNTLACNINYPIIQEQPINVDKYLDINEFDIIKEHGEINVKKTKAIAILLKGEINLRIAAKRKYGFNCLSWDGVKLGLNILIYRYSKRIEKDEKDIKQLRTHTESVKIKDIIFDSVKFKYNSDIKPIFYTNKSKVFTRYTSFYALLEYLKTLEVKTTKEINVEVLFQDLKYDIKSGGLHSFHRAELIEPKSDEEYEDIDVSGYYPSLGSEWQVVPNHLGDEFAEELGDIKNERIDLKKKGLGKSAEANLLKLSLNGGYYGNLNSEYTPMYDWNKLLTITINGQLFLLMLCEQLSEIGVKIDMVNTDGVTILYKKTLKPKVKEIISNWEKMTKMEMESVIYKKVIRANINNYLAVDEKGKTKEKGYFISKPLDDPFMEISRSHDFVIIPIAIREYFLNNTPVKETIIKHTNIYDFCASFKVDKKYTVLWNGIKQQRLNRFYVSKQGAYLYKQSPESKEPENMLKGFTVNIFNVFVDKEQIKIFTTEEGELDLTYFEETLQKYNINYSYYINECKKIINDFQSKQISLL